MRLIGHSFDGDTLTIVQLAVYQCLDEGFYPLTVQWKEVEN